MSSCQKCPRLGHSNLQSESYISRIRDFRIRETETHAHLLINCHPRKRLLPVAADRTGRRGQRQEIPRGEWRLARGEGGGKSDDGSILVCRSRLIAPCSSIPVHPDYLRFLMSSCSQRMIVITILASTDVRFAEYADIGEPRVPDALVLQVLPGQT